MFNCFFVYNFCLVFICFLIFCCDSIFKFFEYYSLKRWCLLYVLSAAAKVLLDDCMSFRSLESVLWNMLFTFQNLRFFANFVTSSSNGTKSFTCGRLLMLLKPNFNPVLCTLGLIWIFAFYKKYGFSCYLRYKIFYFLN